MAICGATVRRALVLGWGAAILLPASIALAGAKPNSFTLSGQTAGTLTLNSSETCKGGNIETTDGVSSVRIYLTDHGVKPTGALWFMIITARKPGKISYPAAYPNQVSLVPTTAPARPPSGPPRQARRTPAR